MLKKSISLLLVLVVMFSMNLMANAETVPPYILETNTSEDLEIQPQFEYTSTTATSLTISNNTASCVARLNGYSGITTKIVIKMTLQKKNWFWWNDEQTWSTTINNCYGSLTRSTPVSSGTYRVQTVFTVYSGSNSEEITT